MKAGNRKKPSAKSKMAAEEQVDNVVEQWATSVADFSSQYGGENSISYVVQNLAGPSTIHPNYGDFTQACVLVSRIF